MAKILFVGPISPPVTGPGVKNKFIIEELNERNIEVAQLNTLKWKKNPFKFFMDLIKESIRNKYVWISVSAKGRLVITSILYITSVFFNVKYILFPAGGSIDEEIDRLPFLIKKLYIKSLQNADYIELESTKLIERLKKFELANLDFFPNPRKKDKYIWKLRKNNITTITFLSKIREGKGPLVLIKAIEELKEKYPLRLELYGPIEKAFEETFFNNIENKNFIVYKGIASPEKVQEILASTDIYVFPSMFDEGLPGVIVEASMSHTPTITTNFKACKEYIKNNQNGIIIDKNNTKQLIDALEGLINNDDLRVTLSNNMEELSKTFNIELLINELTEKLKKKGWNLK